jgi:hypothetical protein
MALWDHPAGRVIGTDSTGVRFGFAEPDTSWNSKPLAGLFACGLKPT